MWDVHISTINVIPCPSTPSRTTNIIPGHTLEYAAPFTDVFLQLNPLPLVLAAKNETLFW